MTAPIQALYKLEQYNPPKDVLFLTSDQMGDLLGDKNPFSGPGVWRVKQGEWPVEQGWQWKKAKDICEGRG